MRKLRTPGRATKLSATSLRASRTTRRLVGTIVLAMSVVSIASCGGEGANPDADEVYTIRITSPLPRGAGHMEGMHWWATEVAERSEGRIEIEEHYGGSLMGALDTLPALQEGRVDAGYMSGAYWPAEMPLWSVDGLPFITEDGYAQAVTLYEMHKENKAFREEWERNGVKLMIAPVATAAVTGVSTPVDNLEALDGKRLRVVGYTAEAFRALGAEPVAVGPGEQYEAIQRGVLDGFGSLMFDAIPFFGLHEVAPHLTYTGVGQYSSVALGLSMETWDSLPPELQDLMTEVAEEYMYEVEPGAAAKHDDEACQLLLEEGATVTIVDSAATEAWQAEVGDSTVNAWKKATVAASQLSEEEVNTFFNDYTARLQAAERDSDYTLGVERCAEVDQ